MEMQFLTVFCLLVSCELSGVLSNSNKTTDLTSKLVPSHKVRKINVNSNSHERRVTLNKIAGKETNVTDVISLVGTTKHLMVSASSRRKYEKTHIMDNSNTKTFLREINGGIHRRRERATTGNEGTASPENEFERVEPLQKPVAQIQPSGFPTDVTSIPEWETSPVEDFEEVFTPFIPLNTRPRTPGVKNPFFPVTGESYGAYAVMCISIVIFTVGIVGNIAIMCIVCHNYYMRSISNSLLANLALWDFIILFFCLPLVIFHELTKDWLLGEFSCKIIPYIEVNAILD